MGDWGGEFLEDLDNGVYDDCPFIDPECFGRPAFPVSRWERESFKEKEYRQKLFEQKKHQNSSKILNKFEQQLQYEIELEREELRELRKSQELANQKIDKKYYSQYKVELLPDVAQIRVLREIAGCYRFVWNNGVFLEQKKYHATRKFLEYEELVRQVLELRKEKKTWFLIKAPVQSLHQTLMELDMECKKFLVNRIDFPQFKKKGKFDAFSYIQGIKMETHPSRFYFPALGWMHYKNIIDIKEKIKVVTVSWCEGKWYGLVVVECEPPWGKNYR